MWPLLIGAGIGAGVGALSGGGDKIWQGALMGAGGGALVGGLGGIGAGAGGAGGGGGLGSMLFGSGAGGKATVGLLGAGGQFGLPQAMSTMGMGMGLAQAFGGGSASGYAPSAAITLTPAGKKLQKSLFETVKKQYGEGLLPPNLASIYIGRIKREGGERQRIARGMLTGAAAKRVRTGRGTAAAISETGQRIEDLVAPTKWREGMKEEEKRNALINLINIMNIEQQTPLLRAQSQLMRSGFGQMRGAMQGQALGDVAQYLGYLKYPPYQTS